MYIERDEEKKGKISDRCITEENINIKKVVEVEFPRTNDYIIESQHDNTSYSLQRTVGKD